MAEIATEMRATQEVVTAVRPWTGGSPRATAALALVAACVLAWAGSASASPVGFVGSSRPASTATSAAASVTPVDRVVAGEQVIPIEPSLGGAAPNASNGERVPFALGALILIFVVVQWLIDRRDPKFVEAPARKDDDSIGFE